MLSPEPLTTLVLKRWPGPSTARAATAVATFSVEAGAAIWPGLRDHSTWPDWSATSADTPEPSEADDSTPLSARSRPEPVGIAPPAALVIAGLDPASGRAAT